MTNKFATSCFILAAALVPVAAAYSADTDSTGKRASTYVKDSAITTKVKAKLAAEKISSLTKIKVETDGAGVVTLRGKVKSQDEADKAVSIAQGTEGVTSVSSNIQVSSK